MLQGTNRSRSEAAETLGIGAAVCDIEKAAGGGLLVDYLIVLIGISGWLGD